MRPERNATTDGLTKSKHQIRVRNTYNHRNIISNNIVTMNHSSNNKRIAKNSLMLYIRQILVLAVNLYTSRVVLQALGIADYGVFNVVCGFVFMFNILSGALSAAISRFITFELGLGNKVILREIYSASLIIQIFMGIVAVGVISSFGLWFLENKMVIPPGTMSVAKFLLLTSSATFFVSLISVPYNAMIIAHEKMSIYAYVSIVEAFLKLLIAFMLLKICYNKLIFYGIATATASLVILILYILYCKKQFEECKFEMRINRCILRPMFAFAGWALLGNGAFVLKDQGVNIILNIFCGPSVNAARGISVQVNSAINSFIASFMTAVRPQITKSYATHDFQAMHNLIFMSSRFSFFLMLILAIPMINNISYLLSIWLVTVPDYTAIFIVLLLCYSLIECLLQPAMTGLLAEGHIKFYEIGLLILNLANLPLSYWALRYGFSPVSTMVIAIALCIAVGILRIWLSGRAYALSAKIFMHKVILNVGVVFAISFVITYFINIPLKHHFFNFVLNSLTDVVLIVGCIYFIGLNRNERQKLLSYTRTKLHI